MFDEIFKRKDVCDLIEELFSYNFRNIVINNSASDFLLSSNERALFTFFDALFKYKIIVETDIFLDEYIVQLRKLFKKMNNFNDINLGISKLIGRFCALKFNIENLDDEISKREILQYIYNKYVVEGYFFHGFSGVYKEQIKMYGFNPEQYQHLYPRFIEIEKIFAKHGFKSGMNKNFDDGYSYFTDSFMMACYYGSNAPMYFYRLLGGNLEIKDCDREAYFKNDYLSCFGNLNKMMKKAGLNDFEKKYVTKVCCDEWKALQKGLSNINILMVKRKTLGLNSLRDVDYIFNSVSDLGDCIYKILNSRFDDIVVDYKLENFNIEFIEIPNYKFLFDVRESQAFEITSKNRIARIREERLNNTYGRVSLLILLGSLFITLGVIISIIAIIRGV